MNTSSRVYAVKTLYRRILSLHRKLPIPLKALGDQYVKDEFRRHKDATSEQAEEFMLEWKMYADMLQQQQTFGPQEIGINLPLGKVDDFSHEQLGQLYTLQQEAMKTDETTENNNY